MIRPRAVGSIVVMNAEALDLARLLFAITAGSHFLFVALTLGMEAILVLVQTRATRGGVACARRRARRRVRAKVRG